MADTPQIKKEDLYSRIEKRVNFIINDSKIFVAAKIGCEESNVKKLAREGRIGGGNYLVALGMLTGIAFLSKIYLILIGKREDFTNSETVEDVRNLKVQLELGLTENQKKLFKKMKMPIVFETNEELAFVRFNKYLRERGVELGFPQNDSELRGFWKKSRNYLIHRLEPAVTLGSLGYEDDALKDFQSIDQIFTHISTYHPQTSAELTNGKRYIFVEALLIQIEKAVLPILRELILAAREEDLDFLEKYLELET